MRFDAQVPPGGKIEFSVPLPPGSQVTIIVSEAHHVEFNELLDASTSSSAFWDNAYDDEDWNDA
jgi:hypothetical protein